MHGLCTTALVRRVALAVGTRVQLIVQSPVFHQVIGDHIGASLGQYHVLLRRALVIRMAFDEHLGLWVGKQKDRYLPQPGDVLVGNGRAVRGEVHDQAPGRFALIRLQAQRAFIEGIGLVRGHPQTVLAGSVVGTAGCRGEHAHGRQQVTQATVHKPPSPLHNRHTPSH
ncbi:hypothetical protein D3C80_1635660 [compost metagenome]